MFHIAPFGNSISLSFSGTLTETGYIYHCGIFKHFLAPLLRGVITAALLWEFSAASPLLVIHIAPIGNNIPLGFSGTLTETGYISLLNLKLFLPPLLRVVITAAPMKEFSATSTLLEFHIATPSNSIQLSF